MPRKRKEIRMMFDDIYDVIRRINNNTVYIIHVPKDDSISKIKIL